jgi:hypothetical protein
MFLHRSFSGIFAKIFLAVVLAAKVNPMLTETDSESSLQGICFLREAPERAIGSDRRAGKR